MRPRLFSSYCLPQSLSHLTICSFIHSRVTEFNSLWLHDYPLPLLSFALRRSVDRDDYSSVLFLLLPSCFRSSPALRERVFRPSSPSVSLILGLEGADKLPKTFSRRVLPSPKFLRCTRYSPFVPCPLPDPLPLFSFLFRPYRLRRTPKSPKIVPKLFLLIHPPNRPLLKISLPTRVLNPDAHSA